MKATAILERNKLTGAKTVRYYNLSVTEFNKLYNLMMLNGRDYSFELLRAETKAHAIDVDLVGRNMGIQFGAPDCTVLLLALEYRLGINIDNDPN